MTRRGSGGSPATCAVAALVHVIANASATEEASLILCYIGVGNTADVQTVWLDEKPRSAQAPAQEDGTMRRQMTLFTPITFTWWQVGLLKLSLLSLGVIIGATWPGLFVDWRDVLLVVFVVPAFYLTYVWFRQL